jgi:hypothetical protein
MKKGQTFKHNPEVRKIVGRLTTSPPLVLPITTSRTLLHYHAKGFGYRIITREVEGGIAVWRIG